MTKHYFPSVNRKYQYLQTNRSDILGNIWSSFNLDFQSNLGAIRLGRKLVQNTTSDDDADLGVPAAFEFFDDRWWAICGTRVFKNSSESLTSTFSEDASTGAQTNFDPDESDLELFNNRLWATTANGLYSKASGSGTGAWTSRDSLGSGRHKLKYFKKFNRLYYIDTTVKVSSIDKDDVVANSTGDYFLDIGNRQGILTTMDASDSEIWLGAMHQDNSASGYGTRGTVMLWDGISSQITKEYDIGAAAVMAIKVDRQGIPHIVDSNGIIQKFNGYGFVEVARFPSNGSLLDGGSTSGEHPIHQNGMEFTENGTLLIAVNNTNDDNAGSVCENFPSGIWELDLSTGHLSHKHSFTYKPRASATITDFGQNIISQIGAIKINTIGSDSSAGRGTLLAGARYFTDASSSKYGIFINSPYNPSSLVEGQKKGYVVLNWIDGSEISEMWSKIWAVYRRFLNSTDKIILKYRLEAEDPTYASITWVDTTHFTTTTDVSAYDGYEVEILQGVGSGHTAHITSVVNNAGTYTVTIDSEATGATTTTAKARFQKWIKCLPEITGQVEAYSKCPIDQSHPRIQIKACMEFTGDDELLKLMLVSHTQVKAES